MRNICTNILWAAKRQYHHNLLNDNRLNPKKFWKAIKEIFPLKTKLSPPLTPNVPSETRASRFAEYYSEVVLFLKNKLEFHTEKPRLEITKFLTTTN